MVSSRFLRLLFLVVVLLSVTLVVATTDEEVAAADEEVAATETTDAAEATETAECAAGECANPEVVEAEAVADDMESEPEAETAPETAVEDPNCPSRELVIRCAGKTLDTNGNGKLDREELQSAIDNLPWYSRGILNILGSVDKMMKKCDIDGDGAIGMGYDMENNQETCLATCFKRRAFKSSFFPDCE